MRNFDLYSEYYDLVYSDKNYQTEANYVHQLIHQYRPTASTILDLGCGTGKHASAFASSGYAVNGVDMSESMLERAVELKKSLPPSVAQRVNFRLGDIRTYRDSSKFDAVVALFHVFSYCTTNADLRAVFETARYHLNPDGLLIFDYWYGPGVLTQTPVTRVKRLQNDRCKVVRVAEPELLPNDNLVNVNYWLLIDAFQTGDSEQLFETHNAILIHSGD